MPPEIVPPTRSSLLDSLTPREREIVHWLCEAKSNSEIGQIVGCSKETVRRHLRHAYQKLGVENRIQAINLLLRENADGIASLSDIVRSGWTRIVASSASFALALADAISGLDLTLDLL